MDVWERMDGCLTASIGASTEAAIQLQLKFLAAAAVVALEQRYCFAFFPWQGMLVCSMYAHPIYVCVCVCVHTSPAVSKSKST